MEETDPTEKKSLQKTEESEVTTEEKVKEDEGNKNVNDFPVVNQKPEKE